MSAPPPTTFVLVHGAWHGGWCWRFVADRLKAGGERVFDRADFGGEFRR